ncbi:hypothetical protein [Gluconacetobacter azotocaptans]|uniref:hypothetical protein n=1 Tax=Gluconacetobacter azotocaptans TaxID=142834 RepID=UPI001604BB12|nr:hypothetical protein [Gluconacetobacter azotocaptans]MBM9402484.1 hypothetical protein [Gluconacetobacter azotocaptans]GBQ33573.1 hypothetical protein AA13594_2665 [Gluconacetobacter azotocaptans DSM 13594]
MIHAISSPRAVTVGSALQLRAVLDALGGENTGQWVLLSPPDAGCTMGPAWWRALIADTGANLEAGLPAFLDCGPAAGRAAEALRLGLRHIVISPACPQLATVRLLADSLGATCLVGRPDSVHLDSLPSPERLRAVLSGAAPPDDASANAPVTLPRPAV